MMKLFKYDDKSGCDRIVVDSIGDHIDVTIESDWYGDTQSGFGAEVSITIPNQAAKELALALAKFLMEPEGNG